MSATSRWDPLGSRGLAEGKVWELQVEDSLLRKESGLGSVVRGQEEQILSLRARGISRAGNSRT